MKKILCLFLLFTSLEGMSQDKDWFFSLSTSFLINSPGYSLKEKMIQQHFNGYSIGFLFGDIQYPLKSRGVNIMARGGRQITSKTMVYALAGVVDFGKVKGYNISQAGGETHPEVNYYLYQFAPGIMYSPGKVMIGMAPALLLLNYKFREEGKKTSSAMGLNMTLQVPLGKRNKTLGLDFVIDANYASNFSMRRETDSKSFFQPGKIRMISGSAGLALSFRPIKPGKDENRL